MTDSDWVTVADSGLPAISVIRPTGGAGSIVAMLPSGHAVFGLVSTEQGIVYSADSTTNEIVRVGLRAKLSGVIPTDVLATGTPYSHTFTATGIEPITFSTDPGSLPPGLSLDATTGVLSGNPLKPGNYNFVVYAQNSVGYDAWRVVEAILPGVRPPTHF